jgi:hypothetical protein
MNNSTQKTVVTYYKGEDQNSTKATAVFSGKLSVSEVERQMLFTRQTPARRIEGFEYKFN